MNYEQVDKKNSYRRHYCNHEHFCSQPAFAADYGEFQGGYSKVSMAWAINAKTEHPKEAAMLVEFLLNDTEAAEIVGSERCIPVSRKLWKQQMQQDS